MIYAYMRVSTPQQTLENQHYALLKFADQRAWRIAIPQKSRCTCCR